MHIIATLFRCFTMKWFCPYSAAQKKPLLNRVCGGLTQMSRVCFAREKSKKKVSRNGVCVCVCAGFHSVCLTSSLFVYSIRFFAFRLLVLINFSMQVSLRCLVVVYSNWRKRRWKWVIGWVRKKGECTNKSKQQIRNQCFEGNTFFFLVNRVFVLFFLFFLRRTSWRYMNVNKCQR